MSCARTITVTIRCMSARTFPVQIGATSKVTALKDLIAEKEGMEKGLQRVSATEFKLFLNEVVLGCFSSILSRGWSSGHLCRLGTG
jgi:hypothetical protein